MSNGATMNFTTQAFAKTVHTTVPLVAMDQEAMITKEQENYILQNFDKLIIDYKPKVREVKIVPPQLNPRKRRLFRFFEEDV